MCGGWDDGATRLEPNITNTDTPSPLPSSPLFSPPLLSSQAEMEQALASLRLQLEQQQAERLRLQDTERQLLLERQREQVRGGRGDWQVCQRLCFLGG